MRKPREADLFPASLLPVQSTEMSILRIWCYPYIIAIAIAIAIAITGDIMIAIDCDWTHSTHTRRLHSQKA